MFHNPQSSTCLIYATNASFLVVKRASRIWVFVDFSEMRAVPCSHSVWHSPVRPCIWVDLPNIPSQHATSPSTRSRSPVGQHQHWRVSMDTEGSVVHSGVTEWRLDLDVCVCENEGSSCAPSACIVHNWGAHKENQSESHQKASITVGLM